VSAEAGFFGPDSVVWKIDRELAVLLGSGSRALLLQVAHPLVAAAVAEHSRYRSDPIGRLRHTLEAIYAFAFSDLEYATRMVQAINRRHTAVTGTAPDGRQYAARDPRLLLWVYATLIDSSLLAYETFVAPLTQQERERAYLEFRRAAHVWGIPAEIFPPGGIRGLRAWMDELIATGEVVVTPQGRDAGRVILRPPVWWLPAFVLAPLEWVAVWLLPPAIREGFGYRWGPRREWLMRRFAALVRVVVPRLPGVVRDLPVARAADRRVGRRRARVRSLQSLRYEGEPRIHAQ
jgi:uncharacterized protein (DUF2236 family)